jgi:hypothetical protein
MTTEMQQKHNDRVDTTKFIQEIGKSNNDTLNTHTIHTDSYRSHSIFS